MKTKTLLSDQIVRSANRGRITLKTMAVKVEGGGDNGHFISAGSGAGGIVVAVAAPVTTEVALFDVL